MDSIVDLLKADLGKELAIIDLYQKYAKDVHDPEVQKILLLLVGESMGHADAFRKLLYKKTLGVELDRSSLSEVALSNLLYFGMKEEREMRIFYEQQLPDIQDEEYAILLRKIIDDEKRHESMLKELFDRLKSPE